MVLPDVQSSADRRNIPIRRVGVKGIRTPILVKSQSGAQHTVADVEMYVSLPADKKGTHMSRFWTLLGGINKPFAPQMMVEVMQEMLASLKSDVQQRDCSGFTPDSLLIASLVMRVANQCGDKDI